MEVKFDNIKENKKYHVRGFIRSTTYFDKKIWAHSEDDAIRTFKESIKSNWGLVDITHTDLDAEEVK